MPTPIQVVCFDIGGVLVRIVQNWAQSCQRVGLPVDARLADPAHRDRLARASHQMETGHLTPHEFLEEITRCSGYTVDHARAVLQGWLIESYPGLDELIDRIHATGLRTAILSNTNALHWRTLTDPAGPYRIVSKVQHPFASHLIRHRKPHAQAFQHVEKALGVPGEAIAYFDDLEENVTAAVHQLWRAHPVDPARDTAPQIEKHLRRLGAL